MGPVACLDHNLPPRVPSNVAFAFWACLENRGSPGDAAALRLLIDGASCAEVALPLAEFGRGERATVCWTFCTPDPGTHRVQLEIFEPNAPQVSGFPRWLLRLRGPYRKLLRFVRARAAFVLPLLERIARALRPPVPSPPPTGDGPPATAASGRPVSGPGGEPLVLSFETTEAVAEPGRDSLDMARASNSWFYFPGEGISWSRAGGTYPLFARGGKGCRLTDITGREYIDYMMGYGCSLLGYAPERVARAVAGFRESVSLLSLTHHLEMEVARKLCDMIPCAEVAVFGKGGSDVCTAAVRLARSFTGRSRVLVCGYHGWHDWYVDDRGFGATGVPGRPHPLVTHFAFNDLTGFLKLLARHRGEVAAVMLEPSAPVDGDGLNGPLADVDPEFLRELAEATRRAGALLIFDEIITGFRYPGGSVQKATGVVPDLACFGKALAAGWPLSALVGRKAVFRAAMHRTFYGPTFKGDVPALAAAREALAVYREADVPAHLGDHGRRLRDGVNRVCREAGLRAELSGPPFRMVLSFHEPDGPRQVLLRTLAQQELLKRGILTYKGFLLPSFAHDEVALGETLAAFTGALAVVAAAGADGEFARRLEIPPIVS